MKTKRNILSFLSGLVLFMAPVLNAHAINSPQIRCLAVDSIGDVTVTWVLPGNINGTFKAYDICTATNKGGPYVTSAVILASGQSSVTINGLGANAAPIYFYIVTDTNGTLPDNYSIPIDTLSSIHLKLTNLIGFAQLNWNAIHTPNLPTSLGWYKVYREYKNVWTLVDSTKALSFLDTVYYCNAKLKYKVEIGDSSGCNSISNQDSGLFQKTIPTKPINLDTVSVNGGTNGIYISWFKSSSPDVIGYIIYNSLRVPIDTIYGLNNLFYYLNNGSGGSGSQGFYVAALDSCGGVSPTSPIQSSLYLTQTPDSCLHNNTLNWTPYVNLVPGVSHYKLYKSINGGPFTILAKTNRTTTTYIDNAVSNPADYCYYVQVVDSNNPSVTASSNIICYKVTINSQPKFSYLRTATVVANSYIEVTAYVDTTPHTTDYVLQRANSNAGPFVNEGKISSTSPYIGFTDLGANPNNQSYVYQIISQNECGYDIDTTQFGQTMYLTALGDGTGINTLNWNDYNQWQKNPSSYTIYRNEDDGPYTLISTVPYTAAGNNTYKDDVSGILLGQGIFSYYIVAIETPPTYPFIDTSMSNIAEAYQDPRMYIPNVFDPKGKNNIFIPVGVFVDLQDYDFQVFDRWGLLVFETHDYTQGWNGTYGGKLTPEGAYVYHIVYTSSKGQYFERKGTVTLLK